MNTFLFISVSFLFTFLVGKILEHAKVPWIFAALLFGLLVSMFGIYQDTVNSDTFTFLAEVGMYFLLFLVGFEINLKEMTKKGGFIIRSSFSIILFEALVSTLIIKWLFGTTWPISFFVGLSFATVGEAVLVPILDEFKLLNTKLGQAIIGIGTIDDIIEIILLIILIVLLGEKDGTNLIMIFSSLAILSSLTYFLRTFKSHNIAFNFKDIKSEFLFIMFLFFLFLGIGSFSDAQPLGALLAGISLKAFLPDKTFKFIEEDVKTIAYGFFAPIFFIWIGASIDLSYIFTKPLLVAILVFATASAKIVGSIIASRKRFNIRESILLGLGISVRFSTGIIITKILYENGIIDDQLFSVIIASSIFFQIFFPVIFSNLIVKWKIAKA